jgi:hypothetical protein
VEVDVDHDSAGGPSGPRLGYCSYCGDETAEVVPHADRHICYLCASGEHAAGRTTGWWEGPAVALPPAPLGVCTRCDRCNTPVRGKRGSEKCQPCGIAMRAAGVATAWDEQPILPRPCPPLFAGGSSGGM